MRILIVGAGIAGLTLSALLQKRGFRPDVIEKKENFKDLGYMLGLYPIGSKVFHGLGLYDRFMEISEPLRTYQMANSEGKVIRSYSMNFLDERYGPIGQCTRGEIIDLLSEQIDTENLRMGTKIKGLEQENDEVLVTFSDDTTASYDLVVAADGIHSEVRKRLFGELPFRDTGWGGWVWWAPGDAAPSDTVSEFWGPGRFLGMYPTRERLGVFAGVPLGEGKETLRRSKRIRSMFDHVARDYPAVFEAMPNDLSELFFWEFNDVRASQWVKGRVVLLGDAAAAFLPTAGVGASMAIESAAVLDDELSRTNARYLPAALDLYEKRRKKRVVAAQNDSRRLASMMFVKSPAISGTRNALMRFYTLKMLARNIMKNMEEPI